VATGLPGTAAVMGVAEAMAATEATEIGWLAALLRLVGQVLVKWLGKTIEIKDKNGYSTEQAFVCRPRSLLVIGSLEEFTKDGNVHHRKFESFERFRRSLRDPEILTFDELFERARLTLALDAAIYAPVEVLLAGSTLEASD
jgi:hypothetical protein